MTLKGCGMAVVMLSRLSGRKAIPRGMDFMATFGTGEMSIFCRVRWISSRMMVGMWRFVWSSS